jgi:hypothetical protein
VNNLENESFIDSKTNYQWNIFEDEEKKTNKRKHEKNY